MADRKPRALVVGSTFGLHYARGLSRPESPIDLVGIVSRGSQRSRNMAKNYGVPFYELPPLNSPGRTLSDVGLPEVDLAAVVVRSAISGGPGDDIVSFFLNRGVSVIQEHPAHPASVIKHLHTARAAEGSPLYALNSFYVTLPTVQNFLHCLQQVREQSRVVGIEVRASIHIFYPVLAILSHMMPGPLPRLLLQQDVTLVQHPAHPDVVTVHIDWAGTPIDIRLYNRIAPLDPDNHAQPLFACVVETEDGELSLDHAHAPTRWQPRSHYINGDLTGDTSTLSCSMVGDPQYCREFTGQEILHDLWPMGVQHRCAQVAAAQTQEEAWGQKELAVVKLWQELAAQLPRPTAIESIAPRTLTFSEPEH